MKVLVTGACGYVGVPLCQELLAAGHQVLGVDALVYNQEYILGGLLGRPGFDFEPLDVRHVEALRPYLKQADAVVPLAAVVGAPACEKAPTFATQVNRDAVVALVEGLSPHQRLLWPNTTSGYGAPGADGLVTEDAPMAPLSLYGRTKCEAEKVVLDHPNSVSLRLATVFGVAPRMRFDLLVNDWPAKLARGGTLSVYEPDFVRNFVHVGDVARCFRWFLDNHGATAGAFNVALPRANLTKRRLAHTVCDALGLPRDRVVVGAGSDPDRRNCGVSTYKLLSTGFEFRRGLEEGVRDVARYATLLTPERLARMTNV